MTFRRKGRDTMGTTLTETLKNRKDHPASARTAGGGKYMAAIKLTYWLGIGADALWAVGLLIPQVYGNLSQKCGNLRCIETILVIGF
jgi:hypothetical protein